MPLGPYSLTGFPAMWAWCGYSPRGLLLPRRPSLGGRYRQEHLRPQTLSLQRASLRAGRQLTMNERRLLERTFEKMTVIIVCNFQTNKQAKTSKLTISQVGVPIMDSSFGGRCHCPRACHSPGQFSLLRACLLAGLFPELFALARC